MTSDALLTVVRPSGRVVLTIPVARQFDVLDAHSNEAGSEQTDQDRRWPEAQAMARQARAA